ncbi:regulator of chromosome condensation 1/beta-lactamase-inhibitor protein II [Whalleya microplaca]|nr:regulator of chromosome condensation 1/beta-lactamase-inhibitor protein II [Whalleya microplaca]
MPPRKNAAAAKASASTRGLRTRMAAQQQQPAADESGDDVDAAAEAQIRNEIGEIPKSLTRGARRAAPMVPPTIAAVEALTGKKRGLQTRIGADRKQYPVIDDDEDEDEEDAPAVEQPKPKNPPKRSKKSAPGPASGPASGPARGGARASNKSTKSRGKAMSRATKPPPKRKPQPRSNKRKNADADADADEDEDEDGDQSDAEEPRRPGKRRKQAEEDGETEDEAERQRKKQKWYEARGPPINGIPTDRLEVYVFGEGSSGELGLGSKKYNGKKPIDVKRPRINHNLDPKTVGVVQIACGGMHVVALTHDHSILTWGVNDDKALGRDTHWEGGTRDIDDEDDDEDDDDTGLNPLESTPGLVDLDGTPEGTRFSQVAATDSASFALTEHGDVYGWGTFRGSDGIIGFSEDVRIQPVPVLLPGLSQITKLACGSNHVLAMDVKGKVFTWGSGGQYQLGRKPLTRHGGPRAGLRPEPCDRFTARHYAVHIGAGSYHSFYIDNHHRVWAWGLNNYSQTGLTDGSGQDDAMVLNPKIVGSLEDYDILQIVGGEHHSVACTEDGKLLTWGRVDGHQVGHPTELYNDENAVFDDNGKPRILAEPTVIDEIKANFVAAGTDTSFVIAPGGQVHSWGFSANYQTGQGTTDDVEEPELIDNTAIRNKRINWAGAGGQYSIITAMSGSIQVSPNFQPPIPEIEIGVSAGGGPQQQSGEQRHPSPPVRQPSPVPDEQPEVQPELQPELQPEVDVGQSASSGASGQIYKTMDASADLEADVEMY